MPWLQRHSNFNLKPFGFYIIFWGAAAATVNATLQQPVSALLRIQITRPKRGEAQKHNFCAAALSTREIEGTCLAAESKRVLWKLAGKRSVDHHRPIGGVV